MAEDYRLPKGHLNELQLYQLQHESHANTDDAKTVVKCEESILSRQGCYLIHPYVVSKRFGYFFAPLVQIFYLLAFLLCIHGAVGAVKELPLEKLHRNDCEDEHEELVHNEDVEDIL